MLRPHSKWGELPVQIGNAHEEEEEEKEEEEGNNTVFIFTY